MYYFDQNISYILDTAYYIDASIYMLHICKFVFLKKTEFNRTSSYGSELLNFDVKLLFSTFFFDCSSEYQCVARQKSDYWFFTSGYVVVISSL